MAGAAAILGLGADNHPLRNAFLKWQCHVRQIAMREQDGRPDDAIMPAVTLSGENEPMGHIITVMNKSPAYSDVAELNHMRRKTNDPAQIRAAAIQFLAATYYQKHRAFSDILTATFPPGSTGAARLRRADEVTLTFEAYAQRFDLSCKVWRLLPKNPLAEATMAHNLLFNPDLPPDTEILGFEPNWASSTSDPKLG